MLAHTYPLLPFSTERFALLLVHQTGHPSCTSKDCSAVSLGIAFYQMPSCLIKEQKVIRKEN
jgi:hypothetical protein